MASERRIAAVCLTARGAALARQLARRGVETHLPRRFALPGDTGVAAYDGHAGVLVRSLFAEVDGLILIMAVGAAVRLVTPLLRDKRSDPAVVVVDDAGRFAISLVSGHLGGANRLTEEVATALGAAPVITTASESAGMPAVDLLGSEWGWRIEPDSSLTAVAAAVVNGDSVGVVQDAGETRWREALPASMAVYPSLQALVAAAPHAAIIVSDRAVCLPLTLARRAAIYRPRTLVLGIGCSSGATDGEIGELIDEALALERLNPLSVACVASLDLKASEPGLLALLEGRGWPLVTYTAAELESVPGHWNRSELVRRAVGCSGVAEPAALRCAGTEELLVRKRKSARATIAIARRAGGEPERGTAWLNVTPS